MSDRFKGHASGLTAPAGDGFAVVAHDVNELPETTRAIYVGTGGTLAVVLESGATLSFAGVPGGTLLPLRLRQVKATGTSAGNLVGLV